MSLHACVLRLFSRVRLCDPVGWSPQGPSVHGLCRRAHWRASPFAGMEPGCPASQAASPPPGGRAARWGHLVAESAPVSPAALTRARGAGNAEGDPGDSAGKNHLPMQETGLPPLGPEGALPCSCLGRPMDRGAWRATAHGVTERDATVPPNKSKRSKHELKQPPGQAPACSPR